MFTYTKFDLNPLSLQRCNRAKPKKRQTKVHNSKGINQKSLKHNHMLKHTQFEQAYNFNHQKSSVFEFIWCNNQKLLMCELVRDNYHIFKHTKFGWNWSLQEGNTVKNKKLDKLRGITPKIIIRNSSSLNSSKIIITH